MDGDTVTGTEILEEVRGIKSSVEERITGFETDYRGKLADLSDHLKTVKDDAGMLDKEAMKLALSEILDQGGRERAAALALPGGGIRSTGEIKMPNFWASDPHDIVMSAKDFDPERAFSTTADAIKTLDIMFQAPALDDNARHLQHLATDVWILDSVARGIKASRGQEYHGFGEEFPKMSTVWSKYVGAYLEQYGVKVALGDIANWIPTRFTSELMELIKVQLRVGALFERFTMPGSPYEWPVDLTDTVGTYHGEVTGVTDPWIDAVKQEPTDEKVTFTARKLRARFLTSSEAVEDALLPLLPLLRRRLVEIQANSEEQVLLDGDRTATHMDNDVSAATDVRKSIGALRFFCQDNSYTTDIGSATNLDGFLTIRKALGEHGTTTDRLVYILGLSQAITILQADVVETVEKYGALATILNGELGRAYGVPIIVSRYVREDVAATGVNTSGGPNTKTYNLVVHRDTFMIGDLRQPSLESERLINTDQVNIVSWRRLDFEYMYGATAHTVAWQGINLTP